MYLKIQELNLSYSYSNIAVICVALHFIVLFRRGKSMRDSHSFLEYLIYCNFCFVQLYGEK